MDYSKHTLQELEEVLSALDKDSYPDRYAEALKYYELARAEKLKETQRLVKQYGDVSGLRKNIRNYTLSGMCTGILLILSLWFLAKGFIYLAVPTIMLVFFTMWLSAKLEGETKCPKCNNSFLYRRPFSFKRTDVFSDRCQSCGFNLDELP